MTEIPESWLAIPFGGLNSYTSVTVDPAASPKQVFELYSVPAFPTRSPERQMGGAIGSTKQRVEPSDVLVCKINPRINRVWQVQEGSGLPQIASSEWIGFRVPGHCSAYFRYLFCSPHFRALICTDLTGVGGSLTRAQPKRVATFELPVAPREEQQRIADKLDTVLARVDACRDRLARIAPLLKRFRQSVLAAATSGRMTEDWRGDLRLQAWEQSTFGEICEDVRYGTSQKCEVLAEGIAVLRIPNVGHNGEVNLTDLKYAKFQPSEMERLALRVGDVLLIRSNGSADLVGKACVIAESSAGLLFAGYLIRLRLNANRVHAQFALFSLSSPEQRQRIERISKSTSGVNNINAEEIRALPIHLPTIREQTEIVRRVETLFAFADRLEARLTRARTDVDRLTPSLLAKAFRGELVPQDPNDEPASELLRRLAEGRAAAQPKSRKRQTG